MSQSWLDWRSRVGVRATPIGNGVFAARSFRKDQVVGIITGEILTDPEYGSNYCIDLGDNVSLEPIEPFRFLNHSCEPNCKMYVIDPAPLHTRASTRSAVGSAVPSLRLLALRKIVAGEQLLIDYAWPADAAIRCLCGAATCRGWIVCPTELHLLKRARKKRESLDRTYSTAGN